jgi:hypothetical protein
MPIIDLAAPAAKQAAYAANYGFLQAGAAGHPDGIGYNYDCIPRDADALVNAVRGIDNFDCTNVATASRMIRLGQTTLPAPGPSAYKFPRSGTNTLGGGGSSGFGQGPFRRSPVFTVSMIEPNWIFTTMENATVQTFDIQLLFGDTSDPIDASAGNPVTFSIIASP